MICEAPAVVTDHSVTSVLFDETLANRTGGENSNRKKSFLMVLIIYNSIKNTWTYPRTEKHKDTHKQLQAHAHADSHTDLHTVAPLRPTGVFEPSPDPL